MPRGERHFETGRCYGKKEPSELMPTNDGWRVESCPPVANGPVITKYAKNSYHSKYLSFHIYKSERYSSVSRASGTLLKVVGAKPTTVPH